MQAASQESLWPPTRPERLDLVTDNRAWPEIAYHVSGDRPGPRPSNARMQQDFGWVPSTPLDEGVRQYIDWIRANGPE
jgi:nucleoside-diphosphate-sugar epimerase